MRRSLPLLLAFFSLVVLVPPAAAVVVDGIAIVVNNDAVLVSEINEVLMPLMQEYRQKFSGKELEKRLADLRETIINQAVETKLILQVAREKGISASEKDIDGRIEIVKNRFPSEEEFFKVLSMKGTTYREYRDQVAEQVVVQQTVQNMVNQDIEVLDNEIRDYYDKYQSEFVTVPRVKLAQIFLSVPAGAAPETVEAIRQRAHQLRVLLDDGMDFSELASNYSEGPNREDGGLLGLVGRNEILPELENVAFGLSSDEVSPVIETTYGFHILKALESMPAREIAFAEAKPIIEERLREKKRSEKYQEWVQQLRGSAFIDIKL
jgi:peptidyl-prolyl cis-trans isomerase SurA